MARIFWTRDPAPGAPDVPASRLTRELTALRKRVFGRRTQDAADGDRPFAAGQLRPPFRISIHMLVIALMVAMIAPAVGFLAYVMKQNEEAHQRQLVEAGGRFAEAITGKLEQEFASAQTVLTLFGSSGWLEFDELQLLHNRARRALLGSGRHLIVLDENLDQLLNTRVDFDAALPKPSDLLFSASVMESSRPAVSNIFFGRVAAAPVFNILRPVTLPDGRKRLLILTRDTESLGNLVSENSATSGWSYAVLDGAGQIVAQATREDGTAEDVPETCLNELPDFFSMRQNGGDSPVFLEGVDRSSWRACIWESDAQLAERGLQWTKVFSATLVWVGMAIAAAILLSTMISRAVAETARIGAALGSGLNVPASPSIVSEIDDVRRSLRAAAAERDRSEQRLHLLMREMAHRAKNQISLTSSLIQLCSRGASSAKDLKDDLTGRLLALGRSIDVATAGGADDTSLRDLIKVQLDPFLAEKEDRLEVRGDEVVISGSVAQSLSLVLHENATNASKHGAWARPGGKVILSWHKADGNLLLDWSETGGAAKASEHAGFGTTLVDTLIERALGGSIERRFGDEGFSCGLILPLDRIEPADRAGSETGVLRQV